MKRAKQRTNKPVKWVDHGAFLSCYIPAHGKLLRRTKWIQVTEPVRWL